MSVFDIIDKNKVEELIFFVAAFLLAAILGKLVIPVLRKLKFGQTVRDDGPQTHLKKQGTPTMGGVIFLVPAAIFSIAAYFVCDLKNILPIAFVTVCFGFIGFLDDWIKIVKKSKDGLRPWQKMLGLGVVSLIFCLYIVFFTDIDNKIYLGLFGLNITIDLTFFFIPFTLFVFLATTNGSNLTDGVDGLCGGVTFIIMLFFAFAGSLDTIANKSVSMFALICAGAILGFLIYNLNPAKVFMGDTGSLALGGAVAACAVIMQRPFIILTAAVIYVAEALSVMIQVGYYKKTKKRIFRMAPLHHHFELGGWSEKKVVRMFWMITLIACAVTYISLYISVK